MSWVEIGWQGWLTLGTLMVILGVLITDRAPADFACLGGLALLLITGVVDLGSGLAGFSNEGVLTVATLYIVAAGLFRSGGLRWVTARLFREIRGLRRSMVRLMVPTALGSSFLNNTPIVALLIPGTIHWARENGEDPARFLIPLSYAAILGGTCTLIGTSTNLVVDGLLRESGHPGLGFFAITPVGIGVGLVGMLFLSLTGPYLLPQRSKKPLFAAPDKYTTEVIVPAESARIGSALGDISLGPLDGLAPVALIRQGVAVAAPAPETLLLEGDHLVFNQPVAKILKLQKYPGFERVPRAAASGPPPNRLLEVVLSHRCPLVGAVVGDGSFRHEYGAAVIAISRQGERIVPGRLEDWRLAAGDVLLLSASDTFDPARLGRDAFLIGEYEEEEETRLSRRGGLALGISLMMVLLAASPLLSIFQATLLAAGAMIGLRLLSPSEARQSLDWTVLLTIAAAFGIAAAMESTGVAEAMAASLKSMGTGPVVTLILFYALTSLLTESITNNAAAALMFPFALSLGASLGVSPLPFAVAIMFAASASFATPLGYQTNLMVFGAGNYQFRDFLKVGVPMNLVTGAAALVLIPIFFPF